MTYSPRLRRPPPSRRASLALRLASLGAAIAGLWPASAHAQDVGAGVGPYVSFVFGDTIGVGWGIETVALLSTDNDCSRGLGDGNWGIGPSIKLGAVNVDTFQMVGGVAGGGSLTGDEAGPALLGEVGIIGSLHEKKWTTGLHTGIDVHSPYFVHGFFRQEWFVGQYGVGVGGMFPQIINKDATCSVGRVLRDADGAAVEPCAPRRFAPRRAPLASCTEPDALARAWADDMQSEAASAPAFLQLAADLLAHDAPDGLVEAALDAAEDEVRHARMCARQAARFGVATFAPQLPATAPRAPLPGVNGLRRLAVESWVDGCLGEGAAAARAAFAARNATDRDAASTQATIARDEARHAELGWRILAWSIQHGGRAVSDAVREARDVSIAPVGTDLPSHRDALAFGRLSVEESIALHRVQESAARDRLAVML